MYQCSTHKNREIKIFCLYTYAYPVHYLDQKDLKYKKMIIPILFSKKYSSIIINPTILYLYI